MTTETTKHTPTKWKWSVTSYTGHIGTEEFSTVTYDITTDAGVMVLSQRVENSLNGHIEGNNRAALILEAVNSFDSLREENKRLRKFAEGILSAVGGNDQLPHPEDAAFYRGYNAVLRRHQSEARQALYPALSEEESSK